MAANSRAASCCPPLQNFATLLILFCKTWRTAFDAAGSCRHSHSRRSARGVCSTRRHSAANSATTQSSRSWPLPGYSANRHISLTKIIFGANVMVFIAMVIASGPSLDFHEQGDGRLRRPHFGPYTDLCLSGDYWRLVTYMFLHGEPLPHRHEHVVPVESGRALRISLRTLDLRRHLPDDGRGRRLGQRGVESASV